MKNLAHVCRQNKLELRMVRRWIQKYEQIAYRCESGDVQKRSTGSGPQTVNVDLKNAFSEWIIDRRSRSLAVHRVDIQRMALEINKTNDDSQSFKASNHWVDIFMSSYDLSVRRSSSLFKLEKHQIIDRAIAYKKIIDKTNFAKYDKHYMIAMDETAG